MGDDSEGSARFISQLRSLRGSRPQPPAEERCELCSRPIPSQHSHVVHVEKRNLLCACRPCYLLFTPQGAAGGKYRAVPENYLDLGDRVLSPSQWDRLQVPVELAFFFFNSNRGARWPSIPARPGRPSRCCRSKPGRRSCGEPAARRPDPRRRGAAGMEAPRRLCLLRRADRCLLRVGGDRAAPLARVPWRRGGLAGHLGVLRRSRRAQRARGARRWRRPIDGGDDVPRLPGSGRPRRALRGGPHPDVPAADHGGDGRAHPRHRAALPDPDRAAPAPLRGSREGAAVRALRRGAALGRDPADPACGPTPP